MARATPARSATMILDEVVALLCAHGVVEGLLTIGSMARGQLTPASDLDLVVVLNELPAPLHVGLTTIDRRLADLLFVEASLIDRILADDFRPVHAEAWLGRVIRWLQAGTVVFDRSGHLAAAQGKVRTGCWLEPISAQELHAAWFGAYYNLWQTKRLLASPDPVHATTVDLRLLFSLSQLWVDYVRVRRLRWEGDKAAIHYLEAHDPAYLALFRRCLAEGDRRRKVQLYERLVELTMAPLGDPWTEGQTSVTFAADVDLSPSAMEAALAFWDGLLDPPVHPSESEHGT